MNFHSQKWNLNQLRIVYFMWIIKVNWFLCKFCVSLHSEGLPAPVGWIPGLSTRLCVRFQDCWQNIYVLGVLAKQLYFRSVRRIVHQDPKSVEKTIMFQECPQDCPPRLQECWKTFMFSNYRQNNNIPKVSIRVSTKISEMLTKQLWFTGFDKVIMFQGCPPRLQGCWPNNYIRELIKNKWLIKNAWQIVF